MTRVQEIEDDADGNAGNGNNGYYALRHWKIIATPPLDYRIARGNMVQKGAKVEVID